MGRGGNVEVGDQSRKFVPLSKDNIYTTQKDNLYSDILQRGVK